MLPSRLFCPAYFYFFGSCSIINEPEFKFNPRFLWFFSFRVCKSGVTSRLRYYCVSVSSCFIFFNLILIVIGLAFNFRPRNPAAYYVGFFPRQRIVGNWITLSNRKLKNNGNFSLIIFFQQINFDRFILRKWLNQQRNLHRKIN